MSEFPVGGPGYDGLPATLIHIAMDDVTHPDNRPLRLALCAPIWFHESLLGPHVTGILCPGCLLVSRKKDLETRLTDPDTGGQKGTKLARFDLLPWDSLWRVAELYGVGAQKYSERNWELGYNWSLSFAAMQRHAALFWSGENLDPETQCHHLTSVIFHALAMLEFTKTHPEKDDRVRTALNLEE